MILDDQNKFSEGQALTVTAVSESVIDKGAAGNLGKPLWLVVKTGTADFAAAGAATLQVTIQTSVDEGFSAPVPLLLSPVIAKDDLGGSVEVWKVKLPQGLLQYLRLSYAVATGPFTAGLLSAFLTEGIEDRP